MWLVVSLAAAGKNLLQMVGHIPSVYSWLIVFVGSSLLMRWIGNSYKHSLSSGSPAASQHSDGTPVTPTFQNVDAFYRTYDNALLLECENNLRKQSDTYTPGIDREKFLLRLCSTIILIALFENLWLMIYRSQLLVLEQLNKSPQKIDSLHSFYGSAVSSYPDTYKTYTFNSWLAFMKSQVLMGEEGDMVHIAVRGREFLKYLLSTGRSADDRRF